MDKFKFVNLNISIMIITIRLNLKIHSVDGRVLKKGWLNFAILV